MKERKPFTRFIEDSHYYRNASITLDEKGGEENGKYRAVASFERLLELNGLTSLRLLSSTQERMPLLCVSVMLSS